MGNIVAALFIQSASLGNYYSAFLPKTTRVPQRSILGPVLFAIYINNITFTKINSSVHIYADDTVVLHFEQSSIKALAIQRFHILI